MDKVLYESPYKNREGKPYLTMKEADNYGTPFVYAERAGRDSIAFVLYDQNRSDGKVFGLIEEFKPGLARHIVTAFGGSLDDHTKTTMDIVLDEVREEAGYIVTKKAITRANQYFVSTQMNQMCHVYYVDVSGAQKVDRDPQDAGEKNSTVVWKHPLEIMTAGQCWKAMCAVSLFGIRVGN
jgi:8-oxo-dGTP pyrophosphatase MutT (NUDIX family)